MRARFDTAQVAEVAKEGAMCALVPSMGKLKATIPPWRRASSSLREASMSGTSRPAVVMSEGIELNPCFVSSQNDPIRPPHHALAASSTSWKNLALPLLSKLTWIGFPWLQNKGEKRWGAT